MALPGQGYVPAGLLTHGPDFSFRYGKRYLQRPDAIALDPVRLPLTQAQYRSAGLFSALRDASPDRWGRKVLGFMAGRAPGSLSEFEILTAMHHPRRMGALAFGRTPAQPESFAAWASGEVFCPPARDLERIARLVARVEDASDDEAVRELRASLPEDALLAALASSLSLGGARPKVQIEMDGSLWIAKFSKRGDPWREPVVEHATMTLAAACGIQTAFTRLVQAGGQTVLLVRRFDRDDAGPRHVLSGFTVAELEEDGDWGSYQGLAESARRLGARGSGPEIFRRMVFNALCSNRDDHPRNHAFFVSRRGIEMTPAFDLVPASIRFPRLELSLACGREGRLASKSNLLSHVAPFGLTPAQTKDIWEEMRAVCSRWREHFGACGVTAQEMEELRHRFALAGDDSSR